jgi:hypothetical protein
MKEVLPWILVGALTTLLAILLIKPPKCPSSTVETDTVTVIKQLTDTIWKTVESPLPYPVYYTDTVVLNVDTAAILAECMKVYHFVDTIADSSLIAVIDEDVYMNRILRRDFSYSILSSKETVITNTVYPSGVYVGPLVGGWSDSFVLGVEASYVKQKGSLSVGFDAIGKQALMSYKRRVGN